MFCVFKQSQACATFTVIFAVAFQTFARREVGFWGLLSVNLILSSLLFPHMSSATVSVFVFVCLVLVDR